MRWCGSMAEQLIRNEQVVGSIPTTSSKQKNLQTCNVINLSRKAEKSYHTGEILCDSFNVRGCPLCGYTKGNLPAQRCFVRS